MRVPGGKGCGQTESGVDGFELDQVRKDVGVGSGVKGVRVLFTKKLRMDAELLKKLSVTDYSLLVGIHHVKRGNKE